MTLAERALAVHTLADLVAFVQALKLDLEQGGATWTNAELSSFLDAMSAWLNDSAGYYKNTAQDSTQLSPWRLMADALMGARSYE